MSLIYETELLHFTPSSFMSLVIANQVYFCSQGEFIFSNSRVKFTQICFSLYKTNFFPLCKKKCLKFCRYPSAMCLHNDIYNYSAGCRISSRRIKLQSWTGDLACHLLFARWQQLIHLWRFNPKGHTWNQEYC